MDSITDLTELVRLLESKDWSEKMSRIKHGEEKE